MTSLNVLIFPGGTEVGLEVFRSLVVKKEIVLFSLSDETVNHAEYVYSNHRIVPNVDNPELLDSLNYWIEKWQIDIIVPTHALVIDFLNRNRNDIKTKLMLVERDAINITRSKNNTYRALHGTVPVPVLYDRDNIKLPAFLKPNSSYGAQGTRKVNRISDLDSVEKSEDCVICEFLPGSEITVDCFSTKAGELLFCSPRSRERIRMGTSLHSSITPEHSQLVNQIAKQILKKINLWGPWFVQLKLDKENNFKLLEVEARIAGTMALHRVTGINFAYLGILESFNKTYSVDTLDLPVTLDRCLNSVYKTPLEYDTVYIDLDDTIVIKNKLNTQIIRFITQCINKNVKVILISKNKMPEPDAYLKNLRINQLFDDVIWLKEHQLKSDFITSGNAIFIDDSFSQRQEVKDRCGIYTFDPSMIELLLCETLQ